MLAPRGAGQAAGCLLRCWALRRACCVAACSWWASRPRQGWSLTRHCTLPASSCARRYVGDDVSPDFYGWVFPKYDHVAVGTGTVVSIYLCV